MMTQQYKTYDQLGLPTYYTEDEMTLPNKQYIYILHILYIHTSSYTLRLYSFGHL